jgi:hypothetical protein
MCSLAQPTDSSWAAMSARVLVASALIALATTSGDFALLHPLCGWGADPMDRDHFAHRAGHARTRGCRDRSGQRRDTGRGDEIGVRVKPEDRTIREPIVISPKLPTGFGLRTRRPAPRAGTARTVSLMATTTTRQVAEEPRKTGRFGTLAPAMTQAEEQRLFIRS